MYPDEVTVDQAAIDKLTSIYQQAYIDISKQLTGATSFGTANRKAILAQIEVILEGFGKDVDEFIRSEIPGQYKQGAEEAVKQLNHVGADVSVSEGFNRIHQQAIESLVSDTAKAFAESIQGVGRSAQQLLNEATKQAITQQLATGKISGDTLKEIKKNVVNIFHDRGIDALVDKGGKSWTLDRYTEMLIRTKSVEARNTGLANRMVENGYDLAQVSDHNSSHPACADWEGEIISLTGADPNYPSLSDAEADGLFHPNCQHAINVLIPSLAEKTQAYNADTGEYEGD